MKQKKKSYVHIPAINVFVELLKFNLENFDYILKLYQDFSKKEDPTLMLRIGEVLIRYFKEQGSKIIEKGFFFFFSNKMYPINF
mgnify:CR=1 FL=1